MKPTNFIQLKKAVKLAEEKILALEDIIHLQDHLHKLAMRQQKVAFPQKDGYEFIPASNILYCFADGSYTNIYLTNSKKMLVSKSLGDIEIMLPSDTFQRIHHSIIVNMQCITNLSRTDGGYVQVEDGKKLMIAKSKKDALLQRLGLKKIN